MAPLGGRTRKLKFAPPARAECYCLRHGKSSLGTQNRAVIILRIGSRQFCSHVNHREEAMSDNQIDSPPAPPDASATYPEKSAPASYPIDSDIKRRWSPRLFEEGRQVEREKILTLLEAARWAPSCFNEQPWRYLVFDGTDPEALEKARACLVEANAWALKAPVLMISIARDNFTHNEEPNRTAQHDVGLASENLVLEAVVQGLAAHQMAGFNAAQARAEFQIPEDYTVLAMIAIGYPYRGSLDQLSEKMRAGELGPRKRKPISEVAFAGRWDAAYGE
jgi:nitroreductase